MSHGPMTSCTATKNQNRRQQVLLDAAEKKVALDAAKKKAALDAAIKAAMEKYWEYITLEQRYEYMFYKLMYQYGKITDAQKIECDKIRLAYLDLSDTLGPYYQVWYAIDRVGAEAALEEVYRAQVASHEERLAHNVAQEAARERREKADWEHKAARKAYVCANKIDKEAIKYFVDTKKCLASSESRLELIYKAYVVADNAADNAHAENSVRKRADCLKKATYAAGVYFVNACHRVVNAQAASAAATRCAIVAHAKLAVAADAASAAAEASVAAAMKVCVSNRIYIKSRRL